MPSNPLAPGVVIIAGLALFISLLSVYVSRRYLPMKMRDAYRKSITALAAAVETKDSGTVGHAQRVARLSIDVARRFGVNGKELDRIEYAALLRDIGKVMVPQSVLNKTGPLTEEDWEVVRSHSILGAEMVESVPFLSHTARYIRHHHEYWDGSGYPDGLAGDEIPLGSRILALASDYDAMVSERPYHSRPMNQAEATDEIRRGSGSKYDPAVVDVFLNVVAAEEDAITDDIALPTKPSD